MISLLADITTSPDAPFWGGFGTTSYKILFVVHILGIIGAFGPLMLSSRLNAEAVKRTGDDAKAFAQIPATVASKIAIPPFIVASLAGIGLVLDSDGLYKFDQSWISMTFSLVLVIGLVYWFLLRPGQQRLIDAVQKGTPEEPDTSADIRSAKAATAAGTGLIHLCMLLLIVLMVWKPGL
jgi:uncharacterized membrane protein